MYRVHTFNFAQHKPQELQDALNKEAQQGWQLAEMVVVHYNGEEVLLVTLKQ